MDDVGKLLGMKGAFFNWEMNVVGKKLVMERHSFGRGQGCSGEFWRMGICRV